jgi:CubicO group peptidase (beta-lactamase class C family)
MHERENQGRGMAYPDQIKIRRLTPILFALLLISYSCHPKTYWQRVILWNAVSITDYQKFPERNIANAPPAFQFQNKPSPELFKKVKYSVLGRKREMDFEKFMQNTRTTAFIVIQNDAILYEHYFNGYERDSVNTSFSVAKSFDSALIGIAISEGLIRSVDDPITDYLPELKGRGLEKVTIRHLLNMSSGIKYTHGKLPWLDEPKTYYDPNLRKLALAVESDHKPVGKYFLYNNYHPLLEGMILERVTKMSVSRYLQEKIWKPLGMEFGATWNLDSDADGFEKMESSLNARAIDFAKFGRLFLKKGDWNGKQVVPEQWVIESTSPDHDDHREWLTYADFKESKGYYKYHWWGRYRDDGNYDFIAIGNLGQFIYVCPEKQLIIVRFGKKYGRIDSWPDVFQSIAGSLPSSGPHF